MFADRYPSAANIIMKDSYVDDIIFSEENSHSSKCRINEIEYILKEGGFNIKEWIISGQNKINNSNDNSEEREEKVLGILWNCSTDKFRFEVTLNFESKAYNKKT